MYRYSNSKLGRLFPYMHFVSKSKTAQMYSGDKKFMMILEAFLKLQTQPWNNWPSEFLIIAPHKVDFDSRRERGPEPALTRECFLGLAVGRHWLGHGFFSSSYRNWWLCVQVSWCYFCAPVMAFLWDFVGESAQHYNLNRYMKSRAHSVRDYSHTHNEKTSAKDLYFLQVLPGCIWYFHFVFWFAHFASVIWL